MSACIYVRANVNMHPERFRVRAANQDELKAHIIQWPPGTRLTMTREQLASISVVPGYVVVNEILVSLGLDESASTQQQRRPAVIEIVEAGRWFVAARVLVWQEDK
jgi:hypothetical protein